MTTFKFTKSQETLYLQLIGNITLDIHSDIKKNLCIQLKEFANLEIDASLITYIDSTGVSILVTAMQLCKQYNINFVITKISDELIHILQEADLEKLFSIDTITQSEQSQNILPKSEVNHENIHDALIAKDLVNMQTQTMESPVTDEHTSFHQDPDTLFKPGTF